MLSISVGPLAFPVAPLWLLATLFFTLWLAGRRAGPQAARLADSAVWWAAAWALLAARVAHVAGHLDAYTDHPLDMLDLRDGGWWSPAGVVAFALSLAWQTRARPALRRALGEAGLAGSALWLAGQGALFVANGGLEDRAPPAVTLQGFPDGAPQPLPALLDGRPVVVNLWASWCGPCRAEMPMLAQAQQANPGVRFLFVNQGEGAEAVRAYLQREGLPLQDVWLDPAARLGPAVGSRGLPTTLFFDARGRRVDAHFGLLSAASLRTRLQALQP